MLRLVSLLRKCNLPGRKKNAHASARAQRANAVDLVSKPALPNFSSPLYLWHSSPMMRNRWNQFAWALVLGLSAALTGCEAPPEVVTPDQDRCDPLVDLEACDGEGRLQCDVVSRIWVFIGTCEPMTHCIETELDEPGRARTTQCVVEKER